MPGGKTSPGKRLKRMRRAKEVSWVSDEFCTLRRPVILPEWMNPKADGCAEIVGLRKTWPDTEGRIRTWITALVYLDVCDKDVLIKRYPPDDDTSFGADLGRFPPILTIDILNDLGFIVE